MIHHVQLACPVGSEGTLRDFHGRVLGWQELAKPSTLAAWWLPARREPRA